ncbi:hypothetical protein ACFXKD_00485 [Nocardiopsis aegyptia]
MVLDWCPELDVLAGYVRDFTQMMVRREGGRLDGWITSHDRVGAVPV